MARRKGSKDIKPRKKPAVKQNAQRASMPANQPGQSTPPDRTALPAAKSSDPERPGIPADDFKAAIAAELGEAVHSSSHDEPGRSPGGSGDGPAGTSPTAPAVDFQPADLTLEGLANAWQTPFWVLALALALLKVAPDPEPIIAVGRRRAKVLAKASYPIWDYYARKYLNVHPDATVNVSIGVTALDGIGIVPDLFEAVMESRRRAFAAAAAVQPATGPASA